MKIKIEIKNDNIEEAYRPYAEYNSCDCLDSLGLTEGAIDNIEDTLRKGLDFEFSPPLTKARTFPPGTSLRVSKRA